MRGGKPPDASRKKLKLFEMCFLLMWCDREEGNTMKNSIRAVSIIALAMSISLIGSDAAMARGKRQTGASTKAHLNFSLRKTSSVLHPSNSFANYKEAWAEFRSTPTRMRSHSGSHSTGMGRSSSFTAGQPKTMQCEFAKLPANVPGRSQRPGQRATARHSSVVAPQTDPRRR